MPEAAPHTDLNWQVLNCTKDGFCVLGNDLEVLLWNPVLAEETGVPALDAVGRTLAELFPELARGTFLSMVERSRNGEVVSVIPWKYEIRQSGRKGYARLELTALKAPVGAVVVAFRDITPLVESRHRLEEQLLQSQKLEGLGQLAGGVAHDFNNLLTIINGYADLLVHDAALTEASREIAGTILFAGQRAADVAKQLLAFSRRQILHPRAVQLNEVFLDLRKMLDRLLGAHIELVENLDPNLAAVFADPGQIQQVMLNIILNARDAMPGGGRLTVETSNVVIDDATLVVYPEAAAGPSVCLSISDTGAGMDEETRLRVFEPFFTTKESGRGTGLGLASVYGIIKQSRGFVWLDSEVGHGTTVKVFLPQMREEGEPVSGETETVAALAVRARTILLVEDQEPVRLFVARVLRAHGHRVLEASNGAEALAVEQAETGPIHLLLSDVVMPGMPSRAMAEQFRTRRPEAVALFISGYSETVLLNNGTLEPDVQLLTKPFSSRELLARIEQALGESHS